MIMEKKITKVSDIICVLIAYISQILYIIFTFYAKAVELFILHTLKKKIHDFYRKNCQLWLYI